MRFVAAVALAICANPSQAEDAPETKQIEFAVDEPINAMIAEHTARLQIVSGVVDRLTLHTAFVTAKGIKPAPIAGNANLRFWGRKEIRGKNRPLEYSIGGVAEKGRAFWFEDVPQPRFDGSIGPWAVPYDIVAIRLSQTTPAETVSEFPYSGGLSHGSIAVFKDPSFVTAVSFGVERDLAYPVASAATGAAIAAAYGGKLSGPEWQQEIAFGVTRPVRLLTLERPFVIGPFAFTRIAVRVRSARDSGGSGDVIDDADADVDPAEIVVTGTSKKARQPAFSFAIGRTALNQCSTISFDKAQKKIRLSCRPG